MRSWSTMIAVVRPSSTSTSGRDSVGMKPCTKVLYVSLIIRCDSAAIVSNTSELLPEPETPVNTVRRRFGSSTLMSLRLFTRAPCTRMRSWRSATCSAGDCVSVLVAALIVSPSPAWRVRHGRPGAGRPPSRGAVWMPGLSPRGEPLQQRVQAGPAADRALLGAIGNDAVPFLGRVEPGGDREARPVADPLQLDRLRVGLAVPLHPERLDEAVGRADLEEVAAGRALLVRAGVRDEPPAAARPEVEAIDRRALAPPLGDQRGIGMGGPDPLDRMIEGPLHPELEIARLREADGVGALLVDGHCRSPFVRSRTSPNRSSCSFTICR